MNSNLNKDLLLVIFVFVQIAILYCWPAVFYFNFWRNCLNEDTDPNSIKNKDVWISIIAVISIAWIVTVPLSYNELIKKENSPEKLYNTVELMSHDEIKVMGLTISRRSPNKAKLLALTINENIG